jgi:hypothetical protein
MSATLAWDSSAATNGMLADAARVETGLTARRSDHRGLPQVAWGEQRARIPASRTAGRLDPRRLVAQGEHSGRSPRCAGSRRLHPRDLFAVGDAGKDAVGRRRMRGGRTSRPGFRLSLARLRDPQLQPLVEPQLRHL